MSHPLDRPAAHALATLQARFALVGPRARRFDPAHALFAAWEDELALAALVAPGDSVAAVEAEPLPAPVGFAVERAACVQMIAERVAAPDADVVTLTEHDAPAMFALARLTRPGPFLDHTHRLGRFVGIRVGAELVAMAGERMHLPGFHEVSAVCTHPAHRGHGYAAALTTFIAGRILRENETPFLQAYADNHAAIALYRRLGFVIRRPVTFSLLRRVASGPT